MISPVYPYVYREHMWYSVSRTKLTPVYPYVYREHNVFNPDRRVAVGLSLCV